MKPSIEGDLGREQREFSAVGSKPEVVVAQFLVATRIKVSRDNRQRGRGRHGRLQVKNGALYPIWPGCALKQIKWSGRLIDDAHLQVAIARFVDRQAVSADRIGRITNRAETRSHYLKLCFRFEYATLNGGEYSLLATVRELMRLAPDWKLEAWGPTQRPGGGKSFGEALAQAGITHLPLEFRTPNGEPRPRDEVEEDIVRLAQARQPEIIHANSLSAGRWLGRVVPRLACPTTAHLRDIIRLTESAVAELARHQRLFAVSEATRHHHVNQGLPADRVVTVYNGLDLEKFSPRPRQGWLRTQLGLPAEALVIGSIGQINLRKGLDVLALAAPEIVAQFPGVHFVHAGERFSQKPESIEFDQRLDETFARLPPPARWHRLGIVEEAAMFYPELDLLVHPARQEPFGRVLLEAAAMNVPLVATNVGGTAEMFHIGEPARLIEPNSPQQLAKVVCDLLGQPETTRESASRTGQAIRDQFPAERCARELVREFRRVGEATSGA